MIIFTVKANESLWDPEILRFPVFEETSLGLSFFKLSFGFYMIKFLTIYLFIVKYLVIQSRNSMKNIILCYIYLRRNLFINTKK
jgi:hypothetical protein